MRNIIFGSWCLFVGGFFAGLNFWYLQKQHDNGYEVSWVAILFLSLIALKAVVLGVSFILSYQPRPDPKAVEEV